MILAGGEAVSYSRKKHLELCLKEQISFIKKHQTCVMVKHNKTFVLITVVQLFLYCLVACRLLMKDLYV